MGRQDPMPVGETHRQTILSVPCGTQNTTLLIVDDHRIVHAVEGLDWSG